MVGRTSSDLFHKPHPTHLFVATSSFKLYQSLNAVKICTDNHMMISIIG